MTMPAGDFEQIMSDADAVQGETMPQPESPEQAAETAAEQAVEAAAESRIRDTLPDAIPEREVRRLTAIVHRIDVLTAAIERSPEAPVNYVLRGEMLLDGGDFDLAADDFQK